MRSQRQGGAVLAEEAELGSKRTQCAGQRSRIRAVVMSWSRLCDLIWKEWWCIHPCPPHPQRVWKGFASGPPATAFTPAGSFLQPSWELPCEAL